MHISFSASVSVKSNFSGPHLSSAALFSGKVGDIEDQHKDDEFGSFFEEIRSYSMACVISSVASLEAYANEIFIDHKEYFPEIEERIVVKFWELYEQKSILDKYSFALFIKDKEEFTKGESPYQDIYALIKLRNALVHFKPEWDDQQNIHKTVSSKLSGRFEPTKFMGPHEPLFPKRWSSSGCTKWAVRSVVDFVTVFDEMAGFDSKIKKQASKLVY